MTTYRCHTISEGQATGEVMFSNDPFCFYLVDPSNGVVLDNNHCLFGQSIAHKILVFPNGSGSSVGPKAMIVKNLDTTLVASAIIMQTPLVNRAPDEFYTDVKDGSTISIDATKGIITTQIE